MTVTEKHLRSKALAGKQDEEVDASRKAEENFDVAKLIGIWENLIEEKDALGLAIGKAKASMDFNLDSAVNVNKSRRYFINTLQNMASRKSSHEIKKGAGKGYVFNNDGNQTAYYYDIDRIVTIDYDRNMVRSLVKKLTREADELSLKIDAALLETKVDHELKFDLLGENVLIIEELTEGMWYYSQL